MAIKTKVTPQDRLVTVSSNDSTPATLLSKVTSSSLTITELNDGGNEQLKIEVLSNPNEMVLLTRFAIAGNGTSYLDTRDWRGRKFKWQCDADPTATPNNNFWGYQHLDVHGAYAGSNFNVGGNGFSGDYQMEAVATGSLVVSIFLEDGSGKIKMTVTGYGTPTTVLNLIVEIRGGPLI